MSSNNAVSASVIGFSPLQETQLALGERLQNLPRRHAISGTDTAVAGEVEPDDLVGAGYHRGPRIAWPHVSLVRKDVAEQETPACEAERQSVFHGIDDARHLSPARPNAHCRGVEVTE